MNMKNTSDYLSNTLFHFWGKGMDEERQLQVFDSIVQNGLLLTCGNNDFIDQFQYYRYSSKRVEHLRLRQWARVCFTEVPRDRLSIIQEKFGSFGIGFSRKNILRWGGCPVWYLPNYFEQETQYGRVAISLTQLMQLIDLLKSMKDKNIYLTLNGKDLSPLDSAKMLDKFIGTIYFYTSHFKEMSTKTGDDQSFLYEKEWRIVHGFHYGPSKSLFRKLTSKEKEALIRDVSSWAQPYQTGIPEIDKTLPNHPIIDDFFWFNGIPELNTVAEAIKQIIVPTKSLSQRVSDYIQSHRNRFSKYLPTIELM